MAWSLPQTFIPRSSPDDGRWRRHLAGAKGGGSLGYVMGYTRTLGADQPPRRSHFSGNTFRRRDYAARSGTYQSTTIRISRSVPRRRAVWASAARNIRAVASSGAVTRTSTPEAQARTAAGPTRSIASTASKTGSGVCIALRPAKRCSSGIPRKQSRRRKDCSPHGRVGEFLGHPDALLSPDEKSIPRADDRFTTMFATCRARKTVTHYG